MQLHQKNHVSNLNAMEQPQQQWPEFANAKNLSFFFNYVILYIILLLIFYYQM